MLPSPGQVKCPTNSAAILPAVRFKTVTAAKLPQPFPKVSWKMASLPFSPVITARKWLTRNSISRTSDCYFVWLRASQVGNVTRAEDITPSLSESDRNRHFLANQPSSRVQHHRSWTRPLWITGWPMAKNQVDAFGKEVCSIVGEKIMLKTMAKAPAAPSLGQEGITEFGGNRKWLGCYVIKWHHAVVHDMTCLKCNPAISPSSPPNPSTHQFTNFIHSNAHPPFPSQSRFHQSIHPSIHSSIHPFKPSIPIPVPSINLKHYFFKLIK